MDSGFTLERHILLQQRVLQIYASSVDDYRLNELNGLIHPKRDKYNSQNYPRNWANDLFGSC